MTVLLSQKPLPISLEWVQGDPVSLSFTVEAQVWSGTHTAAVYASRKEGASKMADLDVTVTVVGGNSQVSMTMDVTASQGVGVGTWAWVMLDGQGRHRAMGQVKVLETPR